MFSGPGEGRNRPHRSSTETATTRTSPNCQGRFSASRPAVPQAPLPEPRRTTSGASPRNGPRGEPRATGRGGPQGAGSRAGPVALPRSAGTAALRLRPRHGSRLRAALRLPGSLRQVVGRLRPVRTRAHAEGDSVQCSASHVHTAPRVARASLGHRSHRTSRV